MSEDNAPSNEANIDFPVDLNMREQMNSASGGGDDPSSALNIPPPIDINTAGSAVQRKISPETSSTFSGSEEFVRGSSGGVTPKHEDRSGMPPLSRNNSNSQPPMFRNDSSQQRILGPIGYSAFNNQNDALTDASNLLAVDQVQIPDSTVADDLGLLNSSWNPQAQDFCVSDIGLGNLSLGGNSGPGGINTDPSHFPRRSESGNCKPPGLGSESVGSIEGGFARSFSAAAAELKPGLLPSRILIPEASTLAPLPALDATTPYYHSGSETPNSQHGYLPHHQQRYIGGPSLHSSSYSPNTYGTPNHVSQRGLLNSSNHCSSGSGFSSGGRSPHAISPRMHGSAHGSSTHGGATPTNAGVDMYIPPGVMSGREYSNRMQPMRGSNPTTPTSQSSTQPSPAPGKIYLVRFKRVCRSFVLGTHAHPNTSIGDFVIVEADRGEDLGVVVDVMNMKAFIERRYQMRSSMDEDDHTVSRIIRSATMAERQQLPEKFHDEQYVVQLCTELAMHTYRLPMAVIDAEYQFDRHKLTIYYNSSSRIDFRELVRDLFSAYKARIWMKKVNQYQQVHQQETDQIATTALATGLHFSQDMPPGTAPIPQLQPQLSHQQGTPMYSANYQQSSRSPRIGRPAQQQQQQLQQPLPYSQPLSSQPIFDGYRNHFQPPAPISNSTGGVSDVLLNEYNQSYLNSNIQQPQHGQLLSGYGSQSELELGNGNLSNFVSSGVSENGGKEISQQPPPDHAIW